MNKLNRIKPIIFTCILGAGIAGLVACTDEDDLLTTEDKFLPLDCGVASGGITENRLNADAKNHLLCRHNQIRSQVALGVYKGLNGLLPVATDMKKLSWDTKLEQVAQGYANNCKWGHNPNRTDQYKALSPLDANGKALSRRIQVGENLAYISFTNSSVATIDFTWRGFQLWEDEGVDYAFGKLGVSDTCTAPLCGHFTQLIWADTDRVGCAVNFCKANTLAEYPATYLVCNYSAAGNYQGEEPYETAIEIEQACSTATGSDICSNGLIQ